jgi:hypothetical protein
LSEPITLMPTPYGFTTSCATCRMFFLSKLPVLVSTLDLAAQAVALLPISITPC